MCQDAIQVDLYLRVGNLIGTAFINIVLNHSDSKVPPASVSGPLVKESDLLFINDDLHVVVVEGDSEIFVIPRCLIDILEITERAWILRIETNPCLKGEDLRDLNQRCV